MERLGMVLGVMEMSSRSMRTPYRESLGVVVTVLLDRYNLYSDS